MNIVTLKANLIYLAEKHVNDDSIRNNIIVQIEKYFINPNDNEFPQIKHIAYEISENSKITDKNDINLMKEIGFYYL